MPRRTRFELWSSLPFLTFWLPAWTVGVTWVVRGALQGGTVGELIASVPFVAGAVAVPAIVLAGARDARARVPELERVVDVDGIALGWRSGRPSLVRAAWTAALVAVPLVAGVVGALPPVIASRSPLVWTYGAALGAAWIAGAGAWVRHLREEVAALERRELEVGRGRLRYRSGRREEQWPLAGLAATASGQELRLTTPSGPRSIAVPLAEDELVEIATWITDAGRVEAVSPLPVPEPLRRLRRLRSAPVAES
jgi:hypothetical protein